MHKRSYNFLLALKAIIFANLAIVLSTTHAENSRQSAIASSEVNLHLSTDLRAELPKLGLPSINGPELVENSQPLPLKLSNSLSLTVAPSSELNIVRLPIQADEKQIFIRSESSWLIQIARWLVISIIFLIVLYSVRHYVFTLNRLFARQRRPYLDIEQTLWPSVTVLIAAHNEEAVIAHSLQSLLEIDYPTDRLHIMPVNDRSQDGTRRIIDDYVYQYPGRFYPFHRASGKPGKAAALKDAVELVDSEIIIVFDADYVPSQGLLKQLVAPFFDPEVGAVMGRVVPMNVDKNFLTRILDLERSGGYQVDQQARMNLGLVPQYGGTVGGVRRSALEEIGGWNDNMLTEDTDATYRLLMAGWKTVYQNRSECYEEVPEKWAVRIRQIKRWSKGHNQVLLRNFFKLLKSREVDWRERLDGLFLLGVFAMSPILLVGWLLNIALFYSGNNDLFSGWLIFFFVLAYGALGNSAAFFEISTAAYLDGNYRRIRLLPLNFFGFLVSLISISWGCIEQMRDAFLNKEIHWDKTERFRPILNRQDDSNSMTKKTG